jgi:toxin ParE1/3/4
MTQPDRSLRLTQAASGDLDGILDWTTTRFGGLQADHYREQLFNAFAALLREPFGFGTKARDDILPGLRSAHIRIGGGRGRHFIFYRIAQDGGLVVIRLLHDSMELARHLPPMGEP